jgi:deoxyribodipyrimidine photo-lyase
MTTVFWFTRDLRLNDNPALNRAVLDSQVSGKDSVVGLYVVDTQAFQGLSGIRQHSLTASLNALNDSMDGGLLVRHAVSVGELPRAIGEVVRAAGAERVIATRGFDPATVELQNKVGHYLASIGVKLFLEDSIYAVNPGSVRKPDGTPYKVYTPFYKGWMALGWQKPQPFNGVDASGKPTITWVKPIDDHGAPLPTKESPIVVKAGEAYALRTWERFKKRALNNYNEDRNRADISGTSHLSHALAHGEIHPRTLLAELGDLPGHEVFRKEIAWREFYGDVLWHHPYSATDYLEPRFSNMRYDEGALAEERLAAWKAGMTGYPMVDAGMRQLATTGWMHNRVRMIVASFLVKDLHLEWQAGADWFEECLTDFDPASNAHGWQWTAGCGTDASPYYRVFNPVLQGLKFDPRGDYVRKYIPELAHIWGAQVHEPWDIIGGYAHGYPAPIVDHSAERDESLKRLEEIKLAKPTFPEN